ncbi:hypothetical protein NUW54_g8224 [Trametes sanguinea]|uniref:Uncharacterized protein n=1 Tax=Trametes sanguinea TaxID=158606 RepID=A0ACC1PHR1_9APHY|nr:hypothetical protein NUW54_g8224 [Trametes sanguinea]
MAVKGNKKRPAQSAQRPSKKRKVAEDGKAAKSKGKGKESKGKDHAFDKPIIPIPNQGDEDDVELSEDDLELLEEYGGAVSFLQSLDEKGIARSKKETERLRQLHKPVRKPVEDDLPSIHSHDEDEDGWSSGASDLDDLPSEEDDGLLRGGAALRGPAPQAPSILGAGI